MQMQAAPLQRVAQIARAVRGQQHDRRLRSVNGADLRDRHLVVGQDLQQERLELLVRLVDLVDQQHRAARLLQRAQQRPRLQELLREEDVAERVQLVQRGGQGVGRPQHVADLVLQDLGVEKLLAVFPLIQRLRLVQSLVALHADQRQVEERRDRLGELGLADAGRPFHQDRLLQMLGEIDGGGDLPAGDVADRGEPLFHCLDRGQFARGRPGRRHSCVWHSRSNPMMLPMGSIRGQAVAKGGGGWHQTGYAGGRDQTECRHRPPPAGAPSPMLCNSSIPSSISSGRSGQLPFASRRSISARIAVLCSTRISCTLGMVV